MPGSRVVLAHLMIAVVAYCTGCDFGPPDHTSQVSGGQDYQLVDRFDTNAGLLRPSHMGLLVTELGKAMSGSRSVLPLGDPASPEEGTIVGLANQNQFIHAGVIGLRLYDNGFNVVAASTWAGDCSLGPSWVIAASNEYEGTLYLLVSETETNRQDCMLVRVDTDGGALSMEVVLTLRDSGQTDLMALVDHGRKIIIPSQTLQIIDTGTGQIVENDLIGSSHPDQWSSADYLAGHGVLLSGDQTIARMEFADWTTLKGLRVREIGPGSWGRWCYDGSVIVRRSGNEIGRIDMRSLTYRRICTIGDDPNGSGRSAIVMSSDRRFAAANLSGPRNETAATVYIDLARREVRPTYLNPVYPYRPFVELARR